MRHLIILCFLAVCLTTAAQNSKPVVTKNVEKEKKIDSLLYRINRLLETNNDLLDEISIDLSLKERFKLYQTENIYTLLQLDTKTGRIDQVQWSLDRDNEGSVTINDEDLTYGNGYGSGTFELYPTKNMYQFILIDKTNGRKWHIQWGMESAKRWIRRIY